MSEPKARKLNPAAERALAEAAARRQETEKQAEKKAVIAKEDPPRQGPEPTRYGDWEKGGIISDF